MKNKTLKWWKAALAALVAAFLVCMTITCAVMTKRAYSDWIVNRNNVQEALYESLSMLFAYVQLLILFGTLSVIVVRWLVRMIRTPKSPGKVSLFFQRYNLLLAILFAVFFILFFLLDRAAWGRIASTVETSEVPAALHDYVLRGWLGIGAELSAEGGIISLVSWLRNRHKKRIEQS